MTTRSSGTEDDGNLPAPRDGMLRADAQRSADALVQAARALFIAKGVDVTTREIATAAGVGMGTLYRRFPRRADLVGAVFQSELNGLADAAITLASDRAPFDALALWMQLYVELLATKRGLARAVSSDDPVYVGIAAQFEQRLHPAASALHRAAVEAGDVPSDPGAAEVLAAVSALCMSTFDDRPDHAGRMVAIFIAGLRASR